MTKHSTKTIKGIKAWRASNRAIIETLEPGMLKKRTRISDGELVEIVRNCLEKSIEMKREKETPVVDDLPF